jgi:hypothetical protein
MPGVSINLLYEALGSEFGVVVQTDDAKRCREKLYLLRKEAKDPDLDCISIVQSPTAPNQLWLVKVKK